MAEQIKFRLWCNDEKKIITESYCICQDGVWKSWRDMEDGDMFNGVLMRYTGLKDKNGKEIYEGDILENPHYEKDDWERCEVKWHEQFARFGLDFYSPYGSEGYTGREQHIDVFVSKAGCYVIGNIYQNPDLLK